MAKSKKAPAKQEVKRIELENGNILIVFDDGSVQLIMNFTSSEASNLFNFNSDDDEEDEDDD